MKRFSSLRGSKKRKSHEGRTGRRQSEPHNLLRTSFMVYRRYPDGALLQSEVLVYRWSYLHGVLEIPGCVPNVRMAPLENTARSLCHIKLMSSNGGLVGESSSWLLRPPHFTPSMCALNQRMRRDD
ncbi:hypothetical protein NFI96_004780 [Prochilodus magdalenae]|nr:hypothetical protein NFI96_004780 [Prochilodus magdalenae]